MNDRCSRLIHNTAAEPVPCGARLKTPDEIRLGLCSLCAGAERDHIKAAVNEDLTDYRTRVEAQREWLRMINQRYQARRRH